MPGHEERLSKFHRMGVKVELEFLTPTQAERLSRILYRVCDIGLMVKNVMQVPEAQVLCHTIPLKDMKPAIQKRF